MHTIVRESPSPEYTAALARGFADLLESEDVVLLSGQLGSGKTTFTRDVAIGLGIDPKLVSSPTFVMLNIYPGGVIAPGPTIPGEESTKAEPRIRPTLAHLDAYRLHGAEDLEPLGWDRVFDASHGRAATGHVLLVEWPERIAEALPASGVCRVNIEQTGRQARRFTFDCPAMWDQRAHFAHFAERTPIACRGTGKMVSPTAPSYPFADERSRLADLYKWFSGSYEISRPIEREDIEEE